MAVGDLVTADQIVARTELPGKVYPVSVANQLGVDPGRLRGYLLKDVGASVTEGEVIAQTPGVLGFFKSESVAAVTGTIESVSTITGMVIYQASPIPVEIDAYIAGRVVEVHTDEGCVVQAPAALIQGIFGLGGEVKGELVSVCAAASDTLRPEQLRAEHKDKIVVGGAYVTLEGLQRAREVGVAGLVTGGFDYDDIKELLGYEVGVAITGAEDLGLTLIVTEGFGAIEMAPATFKLLRAKQGQRASINGATQIRAGVIRPEVVVTLDDEKASLERFIPPEPTGIAIGDTVRGIRAPWFGKIGRVKSLPVELVTMSSETRVRILEIAFDEGTVARVPRANVESIEE